VVTAVNTLEKNLYVKFYFLGAVDFIIKLRKVVNGGKLVLRLLTWDHWNQMLKRGRNLIIINIKWVFNYMYIYAE
jgi:hypothetical protein